MELSQFPITPGLDQTMAQIGGRASRPCGFIIWAISISTFAIAMDENQASCGGRAAIPITASRQLPEDLSSGFQEGAISSSAISLFAAALMALPSLIQQISRLNVVTSWPSTL